MAYRQISTGTP